MQKMFRRGALYGFLSVMNTCLCLKCNKVVQLNNIVLLNEAIVQENVCCVEDIVIFPFNAQLSGNPNPTRVNMRCVTDLCSTKNKQAHPKVHSVGCSRSNVMMVHKSTFPKQHKHGQLDQHLPPRRPTPSPSFPQV